MKFSIMYLTENVNESTGYLKKMTDYRQLPSAILSEETQAKVAKEISMYLQDEEFKKHMSKVLGDNK